MTTRILCLLILTLGVPVVAGADSLSLSPARDNTLFQDAQGDTSNGVGTGIFCGRNSQGRVRRAVIAFDVNSALPADFALDSARVELRMNSSSDQTTRVLALHRVLAGWGEGSSASAGGGGAPAQPGDATWLHTFYPAPFWSTPGGDFVTAPSASLAVLGEGDYVWRSDALTADVRAWLEGSAGSFGWILIGDESVPNTARRFESRESPTVPQRPKLVLYYSQSTPVAETSWGRLKTLYR